MTKKNETKVQRIRRQLNNLDLPDERVNEIVDLVEDIQDEMELRVRKDMTDHLGGQVLDADRRPARIRRAILQALRQEFGRDVHLGTSKVENDDGVECDRVELDFGPTPAEYFDAADKGGPLADTWIFSEFAIDITPVDD